MESLGLSLSNVFSLPYIMSISDDTDPVLTQVSKMVLKELLRINVGGKEEPCERFKSKQKTNGNGITRARQSLKSKKGKKRPKVMIPHPQDVFILAFKHCDMILKQAIVSKCFMCKLAIPFLIPQLPNMPAEVSSFALESVILEWRGSKQDKASEISASSVETEIVSFVRLGKNDGFSKSKMLNSILYHTRSSHSTFYTRDSLLNDCRRVASNGSIEMSWYLPSVSSTDNFNRPIVFFNLRGDAISHPEQIRFLDRVSSVIVLVVTRETKESCDFTKFIEQLSNVKNVLFLVCIGQRSVNDHDDTYYTDDVEDESSDDDKDDKDESSPDDKFSIVETHSNREDDQEFTKELREIIGSLLGQPSPKALSQVIDEAENLGFQSDRLGMDSTIKHADIFSKQLKEELSASKRANFVLQDSWNEMVKLEKQKRRIFDMETGKLDHISTRIKSIVATRQNLVLSYEGRSLLNVFLETITNIHDQHRDKASIPNYMQCIKIRLDDISRRILPTLQKKYSKAWDQYNEAKNLKNEKQQETLRRELNQISQDITDSSLGVEHILREVGQMYTVVSDIPTGSIDRLLLNAFKALPDVVADLMINHGFPLELMDGDSSSVHSTWVEAVFLSLQQNERLKHKKIFVLSVLGVQSSGKSTLLNTMFGMQFAVGAGRCTKGVFAQLIPVDQESSSELPFHYILVVDTEGLRAIELDKGNFQHDNEIATFTIGLGDVTILNIKGENYYDIQDVLQIAVHAFLRMKLVSWKGHSGKKCIFIHQNVPSVSASEKMDAGKKILQKTLDIGAKEAAKLEDNNDIESFNQILEFDWEKNIYYFSDLYLGDLPMAPANRGYSDSVLEVKKHIYSMFSSPHFQKKFCPISDIMTRIKDLWEGIQHDDFVYAFRNTSEILAYTILERDNKERSMSFTDKLLSCARNKADSEFSRCSTKSDFDAAEKTIIAHMGMEIKKQREAHEAELETTYSDHANSHIAELWKAMKHENSRTEESLIRRKVEDDIKRVRTKHCLDIEVKQLFKENLFEQVFTLARKCQNRDSVITATEMKLNFNTLLKGKEEELANIRKQHDTASNARNVEDILGHHFSADKPTLKKILQNTPLESQLAETKTLDSSLQMQGLDMKHDVNIKKDIFNRFKKEIHAIDKVMEIVKVILKVINNQLENLKTLNVPLEEESHWNRLILTFRNKIEEHNETETSYKFTKLFLIKTTVHICRYAFPIFQSIKKAYEDENGIESKFQAHKESLWHMFVSEVRAIEHEDSLPKQICSGLKTFLTNYLRSSISEAIQKELFEEFRSKYDIQKEIMKNLADENEFEGLIDYIIDPTGYVIEWTKKYIDNKYFSLGSDDVTEYATKAKKEINTVLTLLKRIVREAIDSIPASERDSNGNSKLSAFLESFCKLACRDGIRLSTNMFLSHPKTIISNSDLFISGLHKHMQALSQPIRDQFSKVTADTVKWGQSAINDELLETIWGCKEKCPFCNEPCRSSDEDHWSRFGEPHRCLQHRPLALRGPTTNEELVIWTCHDLVQSKDQRFKYNGPDGREESHLYRKYREVYPKWDIGPPNPEFHYWHWVLLRLYPELWSQYNWSTQSEFPESWVQLSKADAVKCLSRMETQV